MTNRSRSRLDDLLELVPPPKRRRDAGSPRRWPKVERTLGTALPDDYKCIVNAYGTGVFNDLLYLFNPFSKNERMNLLNQAGRGESHPKYPHLISYEDTRASFPDECPYPTFPDPGGLLPLGGDTNGGYAFWLTEGQPEGWPLILYPHAFTPIERHNQPLIDFLVLWLSGRLPDCFHGVGKHFINRTDPVFQ